MREAKAEFIQPLAIDVIVVRDQEAPVVFRIYIVRKQRVHDIDEKILPVESGIDLLFRSNHVIDPSIKAIGVGRSRN